MYYSEKRAKEFLRKKGFDILNSFYFSEKDELKKYLGNFKYPVAIKISGRKIVHKAKVGGVKLNVKTPEEVLSVFNKFKKKKDVEGVIIQNQIKGKEIILGIKKTPEFGHVVLFGSGGGKVERVKDVSFRVFPLKRKDVLEMIEETKISKKLKYYEVELVIKNILKFNSVVKKFPKINELDINPLILAKGKAQVVDARILFE